MQFFSFLTYDEDVKKIFLPLFLSLFFVLCFSTVPLVNAAPRIEVAVEGSAPINETETVVFRATGCTNDVAEFTWARYGLFSSNGVQRVTVQPDGTASHRQRHDRGLYWVRVECNNHEFSGKVYFSVLNVASDNGTFRFFTDPANPTARTTNVAFVAEGCQNPPVRFRWNNEGGQTDTEKAVNEIRNGQARYQATEGFDAGNYWLEVHCDGREYGTYTFTVNPADSDDIHFRVDPVNPRARDGNTKLIAEGCPPDSMVKIAWENRGQNEGDQLYTAWSRSADIRADSNGRAIYSQFQGFDPGNYTTEIQCGGVKKNWGTDPDEFQFTVSDVTADPTITPTPPKPVCNRFGADGKCIEVNTPFGVIDTDPGGFVTSVFRLVLSLSGGIALIIIIYAGYTLMMSRGNSEAVQKAKELLTAAIVGLLFIIFSFVIFEFITKDILGIPGFSNTPMPTAAPPDCARFPQLCAPTPTSRPDCVRFPQLCQ